MTLDQEDITAIAAEVVRRLDVRAIARELNRLIHDMSEARMDQAHLVRTTTSKERNAMARALWAQEKAAIKAAEEARALVDPIFAGQMARKQMAEKRARSEKRAANKTAKATKPAK